MDRDEAFSTMDAYLGGFLVLRGFKAEAAYQTGKVVFVFQNSEDLHRAITDFHQGAVVIAAAFTTSIKSLKGQIHDLRRTTDKGDRNDYSRFKT